MKALALLLLLSGGFGRFDSACDIGETPKPGSVRFDDAAGTYTVTGGGANMWKDADAFQFVWRKVSGDITLSADVEFVGQGVDPHRKAALMIRHSLDPDSAYVDAAVHGDGLTSLQYRAAKGGLTAEARAAVTGARQLRLERRGDRFTMFVGDDPSGQVTLTLRDPVYVGLAVCSHNAAVLETAIFGNVTVEPR